MLNKSNKKCSDNNLMIKNLQINSFKSDNIELSQDNY